MGADQSSHSPLADDGEMIYERGDDGLAVEVSSAAVDGDRVSVFLYTSDSKHRTVASQCVQVCFC